MAKKTYILHLIFCFIVNIAFAQQDSVLHQMLGNSASDEDRVKILLDQSKNLNSSNPSLSFDYARQAFELSTDIENKLGKAEALLRMGIFYMNNTDFPKALDHITHSLGLAEELNNKELTTKCLMNLGNIYYENKDFNQAIHFYTKSLDLAKQIKDKNGIAGSLTNFGNVYTDKGEFKMALYNFQKALELYTELKNKQGVSKSMFNIGNIYFYQEKYIEALNYYQKSIKISEKLDNKIDNIIGLIAIGKVYLKLGLLDRAIDYCTQSLDLAWQINSRDDIQRACYTLSNIYKQKKDYKTALGFYQMATNIKEDLYNESKDLEFGKLESKFQLDKQESEIKLLKKDKALKEEQAQKELLFKNVVIVGILMISLIVVSIILYYKNRKEQQINQQLKKKNIEILAQSETLKFLNDELDTFVYRSSHDLKSPLTSVIGLVNILQTDIQNPKHVNYLDKIKVSIDKLMVVLHDLTNYSKNARLDLQVLPIDFKEIVENAVDELKHLENFDKIKIQTNINDKIPFLSDPVRIDILLTNLISNAIVHNDIKKESPFVYIDIETNHNTAEIRIQDSGVGIQEEFVGKVYDMFFKGSNASLGSGLGLYIAKGVIKKLKGEISFDTQDDVGTTFKVRLPNTA